MGEVQTVRWSEPPTLPLAPTRRVLVVGLTISSLLMAACGVPSEQRARPIDSGRLPASLLGSSTVPPPSTTPEVFGQFPVQIWFVQRQRIVAVNRTVDANRDPQSLIDQLVTGPTPAERESSMRSALLSPRLVKSTVRSGGVASVDLDRTFSSLPSAEQLFAVAQVVCSLTSMPGIGLVLFRLEGQSIDVPTGSGNQSSGAVSRDDYRPLMAG